MKRSAWVLLASLITVAVGCDDDPPAEAPDAAPVDAAPVDSAPVDAQADAAPDAQPDAAPDADLDALPPDAAPDAAPDMAPDTAPDMAPDAGCVPAEELCNALDDDCDDRVDESEADVDLGSATGLVASGSTVGATPRTLACGGDPSPAATFRWTAPEAGVWRFETRGSGFDTTLQVRADACDEAPACSDDLAPEDVRSAVEVELAAGESRVITLAGYGPEDRGDFALSVTPAGEAAVSYIGAAALATLRARHAEDEGKTWALSTRSVFPVDWPLQLPEAATWGRSAAEIEAPVTPADAAPDAVHPDFGLPFCAVDGDCVGGRCRAVAATVERVGQAPQRLCMGPSDHVWDQMYRALASTRAVADVSSLDFPDNPAGTAEIQRGRFLVALRNALRYLHDTGAPIRVRFMFGWLVNDFDWDDQLQARVDALTEGIPDETALRLWFGAMNYDLFSWNHSKIFAIDGRLLIQGGINFYSTDYLGPAPVQDISMKLYGPPARDGHRYLDAIWRAFVDDYEGFGGDLDGVSTTLVTLPADLDPPDDTPLPEDDAAAPGRVPVISLGRLGLIDRDGVAEPSPSDDAMLAAIGAARESLAFSLQDLGSVRDGVIIDVPVWGELDFSYGWPERLMRTLTRRALAGVEVQIVISETGAGAYSYGWTKREALDAWREIIEADPDLAAEVVAAEGSVVDFLCARIDFASVRADADADRWGDGSGMGNHAKFWLVDGRAFYIGSQNLYLSNLFEWGLLVDEPATAHRIRQAYWAPLWAASARSAVSGPSAGGRCVLRDAPAQ